MIHTFKPKIAIRYGAIRHLSTDSEMNEEPMLYMADLEFAKEHGGLLTKKIINHLESYFEKLYSRSPIADWNPIIDTRVNMLMKGMYPAIPQWHCDAVPRSEQYSQPDLTKIDPAIRHFCCLLSTHPNGCSQTEYLTQDLTVDVNPNDVWASVDSIVRGMWNVENAYAQDGEIIEFNQSTLHQATACHTPGWRMFFRLTVNSLTKPKNKIRKQVQVYTVQGKGW